jgi:hypothetical protein
MGYLGGVIAAGVVVVLLAVPWFGADSRDGMDWKPIKMSGETPAPRHVRPFSQSPAAVVLRRTAVWLLRRRKWRPRATAT